MERLLTRRRPMGVGITISPTQFCWVACIHAAAGLRIVGAAACELPSSLWQGDILHASQFSTTVRRLQHPRGRYHATLALASTTVQHKRFACLTPADDDGIMAQLERDAPILLGAPLGDFYLDFQPIQPPLGSSQPHWAELTAAPAAVVEPRLQGLTQAGYRLHAIELDQHAMIRACAYLAPKLQPQWQHAIPQLLILESTSTSLRWWRIQGKTLLDAGQHQHHATTNELPAGLLQSIAQADDGGVLVIQRGTSKEALQSIFGAKEYYAVNPLQLLPIAPALQPFVAQGADFVEAFGLAIRGLADAPH